MGFTFKEKGREILEHSAVTLSSFNRKARLKQANKEPGNYPKFLPATTRQHDVNLKETFIARKINPDINLLVNSLPSKMALRELKSSKGISISPDPKKGLSTWLKLPYSLREKIVIEDLEKSL